MAGPYYLRSTDGSDASDGLTWANAKATLAGALAVAVAGERIWVSDNHAETQATAMTLTSAGTAAAPIEILCGNDAAQPPTALATTGAVTTTGTSAISFAGFAAVYGLQFSAGTGAVNVAINFVSTVPWGFVFDTCVFIQPTSGNNSKFFCSSALASADDQLLSLINCDIQLGNHASVGLAPGNGIFLMRGGRFISSSTPATVILPVAPALSTMRFIGVDLTLFGSGKSLVNVGVAGSGSLRVSFEQCQVGASVAVTTGTPLGLGGPVVVFDNCDSADTQTRMQRHCYEGDVYSETTIVRTGGASNGTTPLSHKMASSANRTFYTPLYGPELVSWNNSTGSAKTATVEIVHDSVTALTDAEVWLEVEYLGTIGFPFALFASDRKADMIATAANQTSSSVAWTTTGITDVNKQKLEVTFTPQEIGFVRARVALAAASKTVYVDPILTVSGASASAAQYLIPGGAYLNEAPATGAAGGLLRANLSGGLL